MLQKKRCSNRNLYWSASKLITIKSTYPEQKPKSFLKKCYIRQPCDSFLEKKNTLIPEGRTVIVLIRGVCFHCTFGIQFHKNALMMTFSNLRNEFFIVWKDTKISDSVFQLSTITIAEIQRRSKSKRQDKRFLNKTFPTDCFSAFPDHKLKLKDP